MDRGAWRATVHRVAKSRTRLNKDAERQKRASQVALVVKNPPAKPRDADKLLGWGRSLGGEPGNPLQYSCLENPMGREPDGGRCRESQIDATEYTCTQRGRKDIEK